MRKFVRENGLSLAALLLFLLTLGGQVLTGLTVANDEALQHGDAAMTLGQYVTDGHFVEAVFENWESEFLQMAVFVVLTKFLRQKGSSESKALDGKEEVDQDPRRKRRDPRAPWPVRRGGWVLRVYEHSLSVALTALFLGSFLLHAAGGVRQHNREEQRHGSAPTSMLAYVGSSQFWFESFQNWQSEFLSVAVLVLLSVRLRERGSPQSKPVAAPHDQTGE